MKTRREQLRNNIVQGIVQLADKFQGGPYSLFKVAADAEDALIIIEADSLIATPTESTNDYGRVYHVVISVHVKEPGVTEDGPSVRRRGW